MVEKGLQESSSSRKLQTEKQISQLNYSLIHVPIYGVCKVIIEVMISFSLSEEGFLDTPYSSEMYMYKYLYCIYLYPDVVNFPGWLSRSPRSSPLSMFTCGKIPKQA